MSMLASVLGMACRSNSVFRQYYALGVGIYIV